MGTVPLYEFRCKTCDDTFELRRSMSEANAPATCPSGHDNAVRLLSVFASVGASSASSGASSAPAMPSGGGCGAACGCHH
jgi:putative FmdB family regulatory protein